MNEHIPSAEDKGRLNSIRTQVNTLIDAMENKIDTMDAKQKEKWAVLKRELETQKGLLDERYNAYVAAGQAATKEVKTGFQEAARVVQEAVSSAEEKAKRIITSEEY